MNEGCQKASAMLALMRAKSLSPEQQDQLDAHCRKCSFCREQLQQEDDQMHLQGPGSLLLEEHVGEAIPITIKSPPLPSPSLPFVRSDREGFLSRLVPEGNVKHPGYYMIKLIGQGGMGVVYQGLDALLGRTVAIKVIAQELARNDEARRRFQREATHQARVVHEHVVHIHTVDEAKGVPFIVMEFVAGESLKDRLKVGRLTLRDILRIGMQIAQGLAAAHAEGLVHRDIKPGNILLKNSVDCQHDSKEWVEITDFGLARGADDRSISHPGDVVGTPQYMAPEQALGTTPDARADLFSLGVVLYEMCTGQSPFHAGNVLAVLHRVCHVQPRPIPAINPDIPPEVVRIIEQLLQKEPEKRFQTAGAVAKELRKELDKLPSESATRSGGGAEGQSARRPAPPPPWLTRRRVVLAGAAGLLVALIGGMTWHGLQRPPAASPPPSAVTPSPAEPWRLQVLIVAPHNGYRPDEVFPIKDRLEQAGIQVQVASTALGLAEPEAEASGKKQALQAGLLLESAKAQSYAAVIVAGGKAEEFLAGTPGGQSAGKFLRNMIDAKRVVAGLSTGSLVLADAGVLRGKKAVCEDKHQPRLKEAGAEVVNQPVVVSGRIVTARSGNEAEELVSTLVRLLNQRILFVLAAERFWGKEYYPIRDRLEENGFQVVVASTSMDPATPHSDPKAQATAGGDKPVKPNLLLKDARGADYTAVIFPGGNSEHFRGNGPGTADAKKLIDQLLAEKKQIGAIGSGVLILGDAGVVNGHKIAAQPDYLETLRQQGADAKSIPWAVSGQIVTARSGRDYEDFVKAVLQTLGQGD
jgi:putative intracellular protease/amidase/tRNA A-37 threonylcarbamoyl transferase component Bud32